MKKFLKGLFIGLTAVALPAFLGGIVGYSKGYSDAEEAFQEQIDKNHELLEESLAQEGPAE